MVLHTILTATRTCLVWTVVTMVLGLRQKYTYAKPPIDWRFFAGYTSACLHPHKVFISTFASSVDFLGWVHFPTHRVLRTSSKKRMLRRVGEVTTLDCHKSVYFSAEKDTDFRKDDGAEGEDEAWRDAVVQSYLGLLSWGNGWGLAERISRYFVS